MHESTGTVFVGKALSLLTLSQVKSAHHKLTTLTSVFLRGSPPLMLIFDIERYMAAETCGLDTEAKAWDYLWRAAGTSAM